MVGFEVKDSGKREQYDSGMVRDTQEGKPDYTLIDPVGLERVAVHLVKGAEKYGRDNWRKANSEDELTRFKSSAFRHFMQWLRGDIDEDHMAAVVFNLFAAEYVKGKLESTKQLLGGNKYNIRIVNASSSGYWYYKYIGDELEVVWDAQEKSFYSRTHKSHERPGWILVCDCELI